MIVYKTKSKALIATTVLAGSFSVFSGVATAAPVYFNGSPVLGCSNPVDNTYVCRVSSSTSLDDIAIAESYTVTMPRGVNIAAASVVLGANSVLNADLLSDSTVALGAGAHMNGSLQAGTTVALGAGAKMTGNINAGTTLQWHWVLAQV
jgi:hypothetical protein